MDIFWLLVIVAVGSLLSSWVCLYLVAVVFRWLGFLDQPEKFGYKRKPVPYGAGVALFLNFCIWAPILFVSFPEKAGVMVLFSAIITVISFLDDRSRRVPKLSISPMVRLTIQIIIGATIALTSIKIGYVSSIFSDSILYLDQLVYNIGGMDIFVVPIVFTVIWYVLVFNATNWSDGIPGITSGLSFIVFLIIATLSIRLYLIDETVVAQNNSIFVLTTIAIVAPAVLVFAFYDYRSKVIMGDSGTMFLGFMIATLAIISGGKIATVAAVLGVYIIDAMYVIVARLLKRQSPAKGDREHHLHHRLMKLGYSDHQIRWFIYGIAFLFGTASIFLDKVGKIFLFLILAFIVCSMTGMIRIFKKMKQWK